MPGVNSGAEIAEQAAVTVAATAAPAAVANRPSTATLGSFARPQGAEKDEESRGSLATCRSFAQMEHFFTMSSIWDVMLGHQTDVWASARHFVTPM